MHLASFKVHQVDSVFQSFRAGEKGYYVTITNENHLVTHLGFTSGRHYDVIKIAYIVSVQFKRYFHCSIWESGRSCILCANFSRNAPNLILGGK